MFVQFHRHSERMGCQDLEYVSQSPSQSALLGGGIVQGEHDGGQCCASLSANGSSNQLDFRRVAYFDRFTNCDSAFSTSSATKCCLSALTFTGLETFTRWIRIWCRWTEYKQIIKTINQLHTCIIRVDTNNYDNKRRQKQAQRQKVAASLRAPNLSINLEQTRI